jgi:YVTN family beta-propeller protein
VTQTSDLASLTSAGTVQAISATSGAVVHAAVTVGRQPAWLSLSPDGAEFYALNFLDGTVSVVNTATWTVTATVPTGSGSQPIIGTSTPASLLVTNFNAANGLRIDATSNSVAHTFKTDGRASALQARARTERWPT